MTIQSTPGPIEIRPEDLQLSHRGIKVAFKIRVIAWPVLMACVDEGGGWKVDMLLEDWADDPNPVLRSVNGDTMNWIKTVLIPKMNAWLAKIFPPMANTPSAPTAPSTAPKTDEEALVQIDKALASLKFSVKADGTVAIGF
jgi:hypothetical protein